MADLDIVARAVDNATATLKQVEGQLANFGKTLPHLRGQLQTADKAVNGMTRGMGAMGVAAQKSSGFLKSMASTASGFLLAQVGISAAGGAFGFFTDSVVGMNAQLEKSTLQFRTLLGDADEAERHVKSLFAFAAETPFETQPIIEASRQLLNFGGKALATENTLRMVGDAAAGTSKSINEVAFWVGRAYSSIKAGQPFGEAAMRLQEMGILSSEGRMELEKLTDSGASAADVWLRLTKDFHRFDGAMKLQASTWEGLTSTIKDNVMIGMAEAFEPMFLALKDLATATANFVQTDEFKNWVIDLASFSRIAVTGIGDLFSRINRGWQDAQPALQGLADIVFPNRVFRGTIAMTPKMDLSGVRKDAEAVAKALGFRIPGQKIGPTKSDIDPALAALLELINTIGKTKEATKSAAEIMGVSTSDIVNYLVSIDPAAQAAAMAVDVLKLRIVGLQDQQAGLQASMRSAQEGLRGMQEEVGRLSSALSDAKSRLSDLANTPLKGMGKMDDQMFAIQQTINMLKLKELGGDVSGFKFIDPAMAAFAETLPKTIPELERMLEIMGLQKGLNFDDALRQIKKAAEGVKTELTYEQALKQIRDTKTEISSLEGALAGAQGAVRGQEDAIRGMESASLALSAQIQQVQRDLKIVEDRHGLVTDKLKVGYAWIIEYKDKYKELGSEAQILTAAVDEAVRTMLSTIQEQATTEAEAAIAAIGAVVAAFDEARGRMGLGLNPGLELPPVVPANGGDFGTDNNVTVIVQGNVVAERELALTIRNELSRLGRRTVTGGVLS